MVVPLIQTFYIEMEVFEEGDRGEWNQRGNSEFNLTFVEFELSMEHAGGYVQVTAYGIIPMEKVLSQRFLIVFCQYIGNESIARDWNGLGESL